MAIVIAMVTEVMATVTVMAMAMVMVADTDIVTAITKKTATMVKNDVENKQSFFHDRYK